MSESMTGIMGGPPAGSVRVINHQLPESLWFPESSGSRRLSPDVLVLLVLLLVLKLL